MLNSYKDLIVWQKSIQLVEEVYILTNKFPKDEQYGLSIQMRRAAISIPSNIAEGSRRKDLPEYLQFLRISDASSAELETQIIISKKLYFNLNYQKVDSLLEEIQKMLNVLIQKLNINNLKPKTQNPKPNKGQSLIEIIIAMSIGGILIGSAAVAISLALKSNYDTKTTQTAGFLSSEYTDSLFSIAESNWFSLYNPPASKGPDSQFYLLPSGASYSIAIGATSTIIEGRTFTRYFSIENVNRDSCGVGNITADAVSCSTGPGGIGVSEDSSTQKITIKISWTGGGNLTKIIYLARIRNAIFAQTDWSGGANQENFSTSTNYAIINNKFASSTNISYLSAGVITISGFGGGGGGNATGTIDSTYKWAWNDLIGWIDFGFSTGNVKVYSDRLEGYASSSAGFIALNCNSTPNNDICGTSNFKVSNDGSGNLSGWAWNDGIGWISFCGNASGGSTLSGSNWICPSSPTYQVVISASTGEFSGWAWNDIKGWISFNCSNTGACGTVDYKVKTDWRP
ncbi:four helix bundle protein [Candidatus Wolfebacteria bacterium]|nr:four helix bundle protein [Candidatus Wolfebacteria bacterium]